MKNILIIYFKEPSLTSGEIIRKTITNDTKTIKIEGFEYHLQYVSCVLSNIDCYIFVKEYPMPMLIDSDEEFKNLLRLFSFSAFDSTLERIARTKLFGKTNIVETAIYITLIIIATALLTYILTIHSYGLVNVIMGTGIIIPDLLERRTKKIITKRDILKVKEKENYNKKVFPDVELEIFGQNTRDDTENLNMLIQRAINTQYIKHPFILSAGYQIPIVRNIIAYALSRGWDMDMKLLKQLKEIIKNYPREKGLGLTDSPILR